MRVGVVAGLVLLLATVLGPAARAAEPTLEEDPLSDQARAWIVENGPLRIGWFEGAPPVSVWEDGELAGGYATEAWDLAAVKLSVQVEHVVYPGIPEVVAALRSGEIDVAGAHGDRPDLLEFAVMTEPTAWERVTFVTRPDRVDGLSSFDAGTASTIAGSPLEAALVAGFPDLAYVETPTLPAGVQAVADGDIDLYLGPLATVGSLIRQQDLDLTPVGEAVDIIPIGSWVVPDTPAAEIATAARESLTPAELATLHVRWTGFDLGDPAARATPGWLLPTLGAVAGLLLIAIVFVLVLRRRVRSATAELRSVNEGLEDAVAERTAELSDTAARLRRSNAALQRFTSTAAHDLKGPLTAIAGLADIALRMDLEREQEEDLVRRVSNSAHRLGRMVDDMLEDAISMGAGIAALRGPDFVDWLREVSAPELEVIDGALTVEAPDRVIDADVEVLRRAALNLVGNAVKYAVNEDERVLVHVTLQRLDEVWELRVDDNGPGIPQALWSEVFERGRRLVQDDRGFGLGLAAIRDLVQAAGGSVRIGAADLGGARFTVTLPVRAERADDAADARGVGETPDAVG